MKIMHTLFLSLCLLLLATANLHGLEVPALEGRVNDYAGILSPSTIEQLEGSLKSFEQDQSTQIVVVTIPSLENDSLEEFSIRLAEQWQIGQKGLDNGAILLVAKNERRIRIEVGYGLEGSLTDLTSGRIIRNVIVPYFKKGDFDQGVMSGVSAMMDAVRGEFSAAGKPDSTISRSDPGGLLFMLMAGLFIIGKVLGRNKILAGTVGGVMASVIGLMALGPRWLVVLLLFPVGFVGGLIASSFASSTISSGRRRRTGGYWGTGGGFDGGGGFSGGFGGGGGGFGGGGASGGW